MFEIFLSAIQQMLGTLLGRLTATRAGLLDNLDAGITTRAPASTALSNAQWTNALAAALLAIKQRPPTSYIGGGAAFVTFPSAPTPLIGVVKAASGATTANTLKTLVTHTGAGCLNFVALGTVDATARTIRAKVTIDSVVVLDVTSTSINTAGGGIMPVGSLAGYFDGTYNQGSAIPAKLAYNTSLLVEYASSLTETDKINTYLAREVH